MLNIKNIQGQRGDPRPWHHYNSMKRSLASHKYYADVKHYNEMMASVVKVRQPLPVIKDANYTDNAQQVFGGNVKQQQVFGGKMYNN